MGNDLDPLPSLAHIDPGFAVHVIAIFRAIIRNYPKLQLTSEKTAMWHKFLNAPRESLATVQQAVTRKQSAPRKQKLQHVEWESMSQGEKEEMEVDRRSIRNALKNARASNISKATRILDNVYLDATLSMDEKVKKLRQLHPEGTPPLATTSDFPQIGVVEKHEVISAISKLAPGAAPGPTGLSESIVASPCQ